MLAYATFGANGQLVCSKVGPVSVTALSVWTNLSLGKHSLFVWLNDSSIKTGTRRIIRPDEQFSVVRPERRTTEDSSFRWIMHFVPVFILEKYNLTNN